MLKESKYFLTGLKHCWIIVAVFFLSSIIIAQLLLLLSPVLGIDLMTSCHTLVYALGMLPAILFVILMGRVSHRNNSGGYVRIDEPHRGKFRGTAGGISFYIFLAVGTFTLGVAIDPLANIFAMPDSLRTIYSAMQSAPVDIFLSVAIAAPLAEEFLLRGTMLRGLLATGRQSTSCRRAAYAVLWSAFLFAFIHMNPWQAVPAFIIGAFFGWIYYRSHSIWACIFMHFVNNATSMMLARLFPKFDVDCTLKEVLTSLSGSGSAYPAAVLLSAAICAVCIFMLNRYLPEGGESFTIRTDSPESAAAKSAGSQLNS